MSKKQEKKEAKLVPFAKMIPNFITILGLVVGFSSIRFALDSRWEAAIYCIIIASILDGIDGRVARLLGASSPFGAELDSLCDFANFGITPSIVIYLWSMQQYEFKVLSWASMVLFVACMAIRLARFNTTNFEKKQDKISKYFFTGVPAPSGALLAVTPIMLDFEITANTNISFRSQTLLIDLYIVFVAFLLASRIPTASTKNFHVKPEYLSLFMAVSAVIIITSFIYTWYILPFLAFLYLVSIPICIVIEKRMRKHYAENS